MLARRRAGGGGWSGGRRRRGQDAPPVEFDKFGFPIPPKKSQKEMEEEHQRWMKSLQPDGFEQTDAATLGVAPELVEKDPFIDVTPDADPSMEMGDRDADWDNLPEYAGEFLGMDDPLDAPWRLKAQGLIREVRGPPQNASVDEALGGDKRALVSITDRTSCADAPVYCMLQAVSGAGMEVYDITWHLHHLNVDLTNADESMGSLTSDQITEATRVIEEALFPHDAELRVLER